jgi:hypothetical protein
MAKRGGRPKREGKKSKGGKKILPALATGIAPPAEPTRVGKKKRRKQELAEELGEEA